MHSSVGDENTVNIRVKEQTANDLHGMKQRGDSYDDVIRRVMEERSRLEDEVNRLREQVSDGGS